jgi:dTDP-4-amino-4,6-dideoxygalactose transaminase
MNSPVPFLDLQALHAEIRLELEDAFRRVWETGQFVGGQFVERFEAEWAAYCGVRHAVGVSDGTAALELTLRAFGIGPGDDVMVPVNTFIATWEAVVAVGARPVGVDVDPGTLLMSAEAVDRACTPATAAIIAVHLFGQPVNMDEMRGVATRRGLWLIEDAAQAHGATWRGKPAGSLGDAACFSFYPGKNLGAFGDAGAVVTNRADIAATVRSLSNHGRAQGAANRHDLIGSNRRLDGLQAAILSAKLPHLDRWNARRRAAARCYDEALAGLPLLRPVQVAPGAETSNHLAVVLVDRRDQVRTGLADDGIGTGVHYTVPCHLQPAFAGLNAPAFPVAERAAHLLLSLPMGPHMTADHVQQVARSLSRALEIPSVRARRTAKGAALRMQVPVVPAISSRTAAS